jgi:hypothetical protein
MDTPLRSMGRQARSALCLTGLVLAVSIAVLVTAPNAHASSIGTAQAAGHHVLARQRVTVVGGGDVDARDGWNLYVPPHVVTRNGYGTITSVGDGRVAISVTVPWRGKVEITGPLPSTTETIAHDIDGLWLPEGTRVGQSAVWVTHLSLFSFSGLLKGVQDFLCLTAEDPYDLVGCLLTKGLEYVDQQVALDLVSKVSKSCITALVTSSLYATKGGQIPLTAVKAVLGDKSCEDVAGDSGGSPVITDPTPTPTPAPAPLPTLPVPPEQPLEQLPTVPTAPPSSPTPTFAETPGKGGVATFTDYHDAGGSEGPRISEYETVQVTCRVEGFEPADHGIPDNWWYEIASSPWDNVYYAYAEPFYNNGQTSGSLIGTPPVDTSVPIC